ncbi:hypothetical protein CC78DRAFT_583931 [Lojkania enalia]|uniref:Uncharacterized protein n=1 Tax=Lojkania enalia TaxID=147567 RepID=A0A9P4N6Z3_9PLEO|nr:hypothetical protein CC78DRAFT_583931 [Didymosphaeria enalia]
MKLWWNFPDELPTPIWSKRQQETRSTIQAELKPAAEGDPALWRVAVLSIDSDIDWSIISRKLTTEILLAAVRPLKELDLPSNRTANDALDVVGYVELFWRCDGKRNAVYGPTTFLVSSDFDPPYDVIIGRKEMDRCGT